MIGDVLTSTILFELLKRQYPSSELHYLVNSHTLAVIEKNPFIDKVLLFTPEMEAKKSEIRSLIQEVREQHYDTVIDVYSKLSSNLISYFSGAQHRISYYKWYTQMLYTHPIKRHKGINASVKLAIENRLQLLEPLNIAPDYEIKPKIYLSVSEKEQAEQVLLTNGLNLDNPILMISVLGSGDLKTYPTEYMALVIDTICEELPQAQLLFNYIPKQATKAKAIYDQCNSNSQSKIFFSVFGKSLREFLGFLSKSVALIGNEGGAVNMAKALNIPTFSIFAPWISKKDWALFDNGTTNISVHLEDFQNEAYRSIKNYKDLKPQTSDLYQKFHPELFKTQLIDFLNQLKDKNQTITKDKSHQELE